MLFPVALQIQSGVVLSPLPPCCWYQQPASSARRKWRGHSSMPSSTAPAVTALCCPRRSRWCAGPKFLCNYMSSLPLTNQHDLPGQHGILEEPQELMMPSTSSISRSGHISALCLDMSPYNRTWLSLYCEGLLRGCSAEWKIPG